MYACAFCSKDSKLYKYFICPSHIYRPNMYSVCDEHKELSLKYEDVYPSDGCKPIIKHEYYTNRKWIERNE